MIKNDDNDIIFIQRLLWIVRLYLFCREMILFTVTSTNLKYGNQFIHLWYYDHEYSFYDRKWKINVLFAKNMNFIKRLCCCFNENNRKICNGKKCDEKICNGKKCDEKKMVKSNTIHYHELNGAKIEAVKRFTIVTDVNGNTIVKPYPFIYLGYPFVESDTE